MYMDVTQRTSTMMTLTVPHRTTASSSPTSSSSTTEEPTKDHYPKKDATTKTSTDASTAKTSTTRETTPAPILTVAVFHAHEIGKTQQPLKYHHLQNGDSDDKFLGMATLDVTPLITGKWPNACLDEWLPLQGSSARAQIRVVCEYEPADAAPEPGDWVQFTDYCHPADLYPLCRDRLYRVVDTDTTTATTNNSTSNSSTTNTADGDLVWIQWNSPEGWLSTVAAHRHQLICHERHVTVMDRCHDEFVSLTEKIAHSPLVSAVQTSVQRVPDEGLVGVGLQAVQGGASVLGRWCQNGLGTAVEDIVVATNWDGRFNPQLVLHEDDDEADDDKAGDETDTAKVPSKGSAAAHASSSATAEVLPNMPACPITGEPMRDPVVAADGHTYERTAIARWLQTSDKSPLTGSVLAHKNLVPNYMLLSSLQEAAAAVAASKTSAVRMDDPDERKVAAVETVRHGSDDDAEEDVTTEIDIDA